MGTKQYYLLSTSDTRVVGIKAYYWLRDKYRRMYSNQRCRGFEFNKQGWRKQIGPLFKHLVNAGLTCTLAVIKTNHPERDQNLAPFFVKKRKIVFQQAVPSIAPLATPRVRLNPFTNRTNRTTVTVTTRARMANEVALRQRLREQAATRPTDPYAETML